MSVVYKIHWCRHQ